MPPSKTDRAWLRSGPAEDPPLTDQTVAAFLMQHADKLLRKTPPIEDRPRDPRGFNFRKKAHEVE